MQHPPSFWFSTARPAPEVPRLDRDVRTDVAIIGAGYTGLAAARHLARRGVASVVVEANDVGWGASGRNGGLASLRYKMGWAALARCFGAEPARRLHRLLLEAIDLLEETVLDEHIDCGFERCGYLTAAHGRRALAVFEADTQWLHAEAGDRTPRILDARETCELIGTDCYVGAYFDPRAGGIHPLNYARGLAGALQRRQVPIYVGTAVTRLREEAQGIVLETASANVHAQQVLVATNAYTDLAPFGTDLGSRVIPVWSSIVTTEPLPAEALHDILPQRHVASDTRRLLSYFRIVQGGRLLYGGRGSLTGQETPATYAALERRLGAAFPALRGVGIEHRWSGKIALTPDTFPHVGRLSPRVAYAMGYGGRGVVLTSLLGKMLAQIAMGETIDAGPMSSGRFAPIPLHALRVPAMQAVAGYYAVLDCLKL